MNLAFFLKILTDLCYYGMFAAFFASFYGLTGSILPQFALIALSAAVSRALWQKKPAARFLSLFLCLPAFLLPTATAGLVILTPAALYVLWTVWSGRFHLTYYTAADQFLLELKLLGLPALMTLALMQLKRAEQFSLPYLLVFLLGSVLLLRMVRHDEDTLRQPRFRLMNCLTMAGLCALCLFLSSPWFRAAVGLVLKACWKVLSLPLLLVAVVFGGALGLIFDAVIPDDFRFEPIQLEGMLPEIGEEEKEVMEEVAGNPELAEKAAYVFSAVGIVLAVILIVLLFRWLSAKRRGLPSSVGDEVRYAASPLAAQEKPLTRLNARTPDLQVRYWYQQLLRKTRQEGGELRPTMNTRQQRDVESEIFKEDGLISRLRALYLPARYKGQATEQDAREAKELYQKIKKG